MTENFEPTAAIATGRRTLADSRRRVRLYVGQLMTGELVNKILRFSALVLFARGLSASDFGLVNVGIAISGIALVASSLGLPDLGARDVSVAPERAGWLAGRVAVTRVLVLGSFVAIGLTVSSFVWPGHAPLLAMASLMAVCMAISGDWLARGLEQMSLLAVATAVGGFIVLGGSVLAAMLSFGATAALAVFAIAEGVVAAVLWWRLYPMTRVEFGVRGMGAMLRRARPLALSSLAIYSYYANLDTIILAATRSSREAGLYSAPYRLFLVLNLVGIFAAYAMLPTLARFAASDAEADASQLLQSALVSLAAYGLLTLGLVELFGAEGLELLFGAPFRAAAGAFVLLAAGVAWYAVGYPVGYSLIARGENSRFLLGAASAGVLSLGLDLALIPPLGMSGAGLATTVAFAAGAAIWISARGSFRGRLAILVALGTTSGLAAIVVFADWSEAIAGLVTIGIAVALLSIRWGRLAHV